MVAAKSRKKDRPKPSESSGKATWSPREVAWWIAVAVCGLGAYVLASHGLFYTAGVWQIPLFVGCAVGLMSRNRVQAAVTAGVVTLVAFVVLPPALPFGATVRPLELALAPVLAAGSATLLAHARTAWWRGRTSRFRVIVAVVMVGWVLFNFWLPLFLTGMPPQGYGWLRASTISEVPPPGDYDLDSQIYLRVYYLTHQGESYYPALQRALTREGNPSHPAPTSVLGYRLPTLFWIWRLLPSNAFWLVYLFLAMSTMGIVAAAFITGQLVDARFAPLAAAAMAAYAMAAAVTGAVTYVDLPAASIALVGFALFVRSLRTGAQGPLWAAAGVMALAALTREILAYLIVLAALSALLGAPGERRRAALPWLAALGVFALGYAAHAVTVSGYVSQSRSAFLSPGGLGFVWSAVTNFSASTNGGELALLSLYLLGVAGAYASRRRVGLPFSVLALTALILPLLLMLRVGNNSLTAGGEVFNYWGLLVMPLALSLWPAWVLSLWRDPGAE